MTDTGRVPGEGQPGHADAQPEAQQPHPTAPAHGAYAYTDPGADHHAAGDDEDLLMPGAQSAWSDGQATSGQHAARSPQHQPAHAGQPAAAQAGAPRRPLHLGPPVPEQSGAVRTLADRGPRTPPPAQPQVAVPVPVPQDVPEPVPGPGPEYLDVPHQEVADDLPGPQLGVFPPQQEAPAEAPAAESADPVAAPPLPGPDLAAVPHAPAPPEAAEAPEVAEAPAAPEASEVVLPGADPAATAPPPAAERDVPPVPTVPAPEAQPQPQPQAMAESVVSAPGETPSAPHETLVEADAVTDEGATTDQPEPDPGAGTAPEESVALAPPPPDEAPQEVPSAAHPPGQAQAGPPVPEQEAVPSPAAEPAPGADHSTAVPPVAVPSAPATGAAPAPVAETEPAPPEVVPGVAHDTSAPGAAEGDLPAPSDPEPREEEAGTGVVAETPAPDAAGTEQEPAPAEPPLPQPGQTPTQAPPSPETPAEAAAADAGPQSGTAEAPPTAQAAPPISDGTASEETAPEETAPEAAVPSGDGAADGTPSHAPDAEPTAPAPGYDDADREAVHRLMRERRDVRNGFRPDPIPHDVLLRVLEAAHTAPSVGHSQPWDFVVIRSEETRRTMHELATRQREAYAKSLPKARAKQFKELKVEAILDTPVNIVVTADPTRGGRHTLGRHTQPQMAPYSSALAVENLWLAARAEGLGVGWVSFFDEREMVRALDLPGHLEVVAYLCIGYVDEFPAEPELMQAGWSKRRPLSWVVHEESYGRRVLPGAEPHDLLAETLERIRPLDAKALGEAWERQKRMTKPAGALGMLEIISAQLCGLSRQCPPPVPEPAAVAVFAGDHGVHAQGVSPWPQEVTAQMVANFLGGGAVCNAFANQVGAEVCVVDVGVAAELPAAPGLLPRKVRPGTADMTQGPALGQEEVLRAIEVGIETARDLVAAGNKALATGEMGIGNTTASAALIAACTGCDPAEVTGRGTGIDDETHARKIDVVRRALQLHQPDPADPIGLLAAVGGLEHAALTGLILGGASLRTPVILDGVSAGAAALVARQIAPEALAACVAGHRSAEPGHVAALTKLGLRPLIDLDLRLGEGTGALLALPMVQSAARAMHEVATFDSAGVTEKN